MRAGIALKAEQVSLVFLPFQMGTAVPPFRRRGFVSLDGHFHEQSVQLLRQRTWEVMANFRGDMIWAARFAWAHLAKRELQFTQRWQIPNWKGQF